MADKPLDVYLNDHLAGATFGSDLARRLAERVGGAQIAAVAEDIEADRRTLQELMDRLGTARNPVKQATTWMAEKVSQVKLSGLSSGEDQLGLFMALETLTLGVEGKASMWSALTDIRERYPALHGTDFEGLRRRAERQREALEAEREVVAQRAFTGDDAS